MRKYSHFHSFQEEKKKKDLKYNFMECEHRLGIVACLEFVFAQW